MSNDFSKYDEFANRMEEKYPKMFGHKHYGGFAVGAGWWPILEALCSNIQSYIDWKQEQAEKYQRGEGCPQVVVAQIKEKFGGLRFYYTGGDATVDGMIRIAESWAAVSCEECGKPGIRRSGGWIRTLCDEHYIEQCAKEEARFSEYS
jgi:hypothetical protein